MSKNRIKALEAYDWKGDPRIAGLSGPAQFMLFRMVLAADERGHFIQDRHDPAFYGMTDKQLGHGLIELAEAGLIELSHSNGFELPAVRNHLAGRSA